MLILVAFIFCNSLKPQILMKKSLFMLLVAVTIFSACSTNDSADDVSPSLIIKFKFDPNQERLNNLGQVAPMLAGHDGQSPVFAKISSHYLEFAPTSNTLLGSGAVLYHASETTAGGANAIDFNKSKLVKEGEVFLKVPLSQLAKGTYQWVRCSLSYQEFDIKIRESGVDVNGTVASFVGFNTYIDAFSLGTVPFVVNGNKLQGYWALNAINKGFSGQAPPGATTVPNPITSTSPVPAGSCVVTGRFPTDLVITGTETKDVTITLSLSVNKSFEWNEVKVDGKWEPSVGEQVFDMGLRGLIPYYSK
jgi:hypothetical protein